MRISYRNASADDFKSAVDILIENMDLSVFTKATDKSILYNFATISLAKDFHRANYIRIAECDDKVCAILIGYAGTVSAPPFSFNHDLITKIAKEKLQKSAEGQMVIAEMEKSREAVKDIDPNNVTSKCGSELIFFATDSKYRRNKIGSTLIKSFEEYLKEFGIKKYYLYTHSQCSYQYYENNGYIRVEKKTSAFKPSIEHYTFIKEL